MQEVQVKKNEIWTKVPSQSPADYGLEKFLYKIGHTAFTGWRKVAAPFVPKKHNHDKENARRRRQIAKGMLQVTKR